MMKMIMAIGSNTALINYIEKLQIIFSKNEANTFGAKHDIDG